MVVHDTYIASHGIKDNPLLKYIHYGEQLLFYLHSSSMNFLVWRA
jgi:hypothetical protein